MKHAILVLAAAAALASCGRQNPVANGAENASGLPGPAGQSPASPTGGPPTDNRSDTAAAPSNASVIPAALQGRWGLTPGDCTSNGGGSQGLLVITAEDLRFYESRALPGENVQTSASSVSGDFAFTGEGQEWTKYQSLQLEAGKLTRSERDPAARFTYARCE